MAAEAENRAFDLAQKWVRLDPYYEEKDLTPREQALMRLAIRCLWSGNLVEAAIARRVAAVEARQEYGGHSTQ